MYVKNINVWCLGCSTWVYSVLSTYLCIHKLNKKQHSTTASGQPCITWPVHQTFLNLLCLQVCTLHVQLRIIIYLLCSTRVRGVIQFKDQKASNLFCIPLNKYICDTVVYKSQVKSFNKLHVIFEDILELSIWPWWLI